MSRANFRAFCAEVRSYETNDSGAGKAPLTVYKVSYVYDGVGNRTSMSVDSAVTNYFYDAADELTTIVNPDSSITTQTFDATGNLTLVNAAGNLTTYLWDDQNRLSEAVIDGSAEIAIYNADGRLRGGTGGGETTGYLWDIENLLRIDSAEGTPGESIARATDYPGYWGGLTSLNVTEATSNISLFLGYVPQGAARAHAVVSL